MLITSYYPQVSMVTTNVATDLARMDNQQKAPILPPQQLSKKHHSRAFNAEYERAKQHPIIEQRNQQQALARRFMMQQSSVSASMEKAPALAMLVAESDFPALSRKDIRIKQTPDAKAGIFNALMLADDEQVESEKAVATHQHKLNRAYLSRPPQIGTQLNAFV